MSIIDLPDWLNPQTLSPPRLLRSTATSVGRYSSASDVADMMSGDTWAMSIGLAPTRLADSGRVEALVNQLVGGVNVLRCHHLGRPVPLGSLRGAPVLAAPLAVGDSVLQVANARAGVNALRNPSFEVDANADGVPDHWAVYTNGTTGLVDSYRASDASAVAHGGWGWVILPHGLGGSHEDRAGVSFGPVLDVVAGSSACLSAWVRVAASVATHVRLLLNFVDASDVYVGSIDSGVSIASPSTLTRVSFGGVVPAGAAKANVNIWLAGSGVAAGLASLSIDAVQLQFGAQAPTGADLDVRLRAGDMLGVGGQLLQVAQDVVLDGNGDGLVPVVNRVRAAVAAGTAVQWSRPTTVWRLAGSPTQMMQPGYASGVQLDLLEKAY